MSIDAKAVIAEVLNAWAASDEIGVRAWALGLTDLTIEDFGDLIPELLTHLQAATGLLADQPGMDRAEAVRAVCHLAAQLAEDE
jgi:hypothetical protein